MANLSNINNKFIVTDGGNVLIGPTGNTSYRLDVGGNIRVPYANGYFMDTTGAAGSNFVKTINDYETVIGTDRGSAGFAVFGNSNIRIGFGTAYTSAQTKLLINSSGDVGIGATDPVKTLDVRGQLAISNSASSYWYLDRNDSTGNFEIFDDGDINRLTIDISGNLMIGGTTTFNGVTGETGFEIYGNTAQLLINNPSYNWFTIYSASDANIYNVFGSSGNYLIGTGNKDTSSWSEKMRIDSSGNVTIGSSTLTGSRSLTLLSATNATNYDINFQQAGTTNFGRIRFTEGAADFQFFAQVGQDPNLTLQYGGNSFFSRGNVGIGTDSPDAKLHVEGGIGIFNVSDDWQQSTLGTYLFRGANFATTISNETSTLKIFPAFSGTRTVGQYWGGINFMHLDPDNSTWGTDYTGAQFWIGGRYTSGAGQELSALVFAVNSLTTTGSQPTEKMVILPNGDVGIGTTSPTSRLEAFRYSGDRTTLTTVLSVSSQGSGPYTNFGSKISFKSNIYYGVTTPGIIETAYVGAIMGPDYENDSSLVFATRQNATTVDEKMRILGDGSVGINTETPRAKLEVASDITIQNGVYTYKAGGYTTGASTINVDIPVGSDVGYGNVFKIEAGFAHYHGMTYNSIGEWWCTTRGTVAVNTYILNAGTAFAGTWSSSKTNNSTLRVTKTAGSYGGGGKWWVKVTYVPF